MKKIILATLISISCLAVFAGEKGEAKKTTSTTVSGVVVDAENGEALVGVAVNLDGEVQYTDFDGVFTFDNIKEGTHSLKANYVSYQEAEQALSLNSSSNLEIALNRK